MHWRQENHASVATPKRDIDIFCRTTSSKSREDTGIVTHQQNIWIMTRHHQDTGIVTNQQNIWIMARHNQDSVSSNQIPGYSDSNSSTGHMIMTHHQDTAISNPVPGYSDSNPSTGHMIMTHHQDTAIGNPVPGYSDSNPSNPGRSGGKFFFSRVNFLC